MADRPINRGRKARKKVCGFCVDKVEHIDYKTSLVFVVICQREVRSFLAV